MSARAAAEIVPIYLGAQPPAFGMLHVPDPAAASTAVLLLPPFGWEDVCSYRSRRDWAQQLASAGCATLRLDLPGAGDSGEPQAGDSLLEAWVRSAVLAAGDLRRRSGCERLAVIGIGLGGLLALAAVSRGAPIDELVLWAVPKRGRRLVRELRAFASLEHEAGDAGENGQQPAGALIAGGFTLDAETTAALERLDVATALPSAGTLRRALLLERDGIAPEGPLSEHLGSVGVSVSVAPGPGYGAMMAKPDFARAPTEVFETVRSWLLDNCLPAGRSHPAAPAGRSHPAAPAGRSDATDPGRSAVAVAARAPVEAGQRIELRDGDARFAERPLTVERDFGSLFGILTEPLEQPPQKLCLVLLNAGAIRRIGPSRMWVQAARRWAARGVPALRLDSEGIGDADGRAFTDPAELHVPARIEQVRATLDRLEREGIGSRFVLTGLCSGAYWSFQVALEDERVLAAVLLNPRVLIWSRSLAIARDFRRGVLRASSWRKLARGEFARSRVLALALRAPLTVPQSRLAAWRAGRAGDDELDGLLDRLRDAGKSVYMHFSGDEPLREELELDGRVARLRRWPNVTIGSLPGRDHTLRPAAAQRAAHAALDAALERELARLTSTGVR